MNREQFPKRWKQFRRLARESWDELNDDIDQVQGRFERRNRREDPGSVRSVVRNRRRVSERLA